MDKLTDKLTREELIKSSVCDCKWNFKCCYKYICRVNKGFYQENEHELWEQVKHLWHSWNGFWTPKGCAIPKELRSAMCLGANEKNMKCKPSLKNRIKTWLKRSFTMRKYGVVLWTLCLVALLSVCAIFDARPDFCPECGAPAEHVRELNGTRRGALQMLDELMCPLAQAEPLDTYHSGWHVVRATAAEDGATFAAVIDLAGAEGDFANKDGNITTFQIPSVNVGVGPNEGISAGAVWVFVFAGTDAADETFSFDLVGWRKTNGMAQVICTGNGILGTQDVVLYPDDDSTTATNGFWADTIVVDDITNWPGNIGLFNEGGNNQVTMLIVDMTGLEFVYPVIYDAAGSAEAASITVFGARY